MGCGASAGPKAPATVIEEPAEAVGAWKPAEPAEAPAAAAPAVGRASSDKKVEIVGGEKKEDHHHHHKGKTPCRDFKNGHCKFGDRCKYSHDVDSAPRKSRVPCRDFLKGSCKHGDKCRYSHDIEKRASIDENPDGREEGGGGGAAPEEFPTSPKRRAPVEKLPDIDYETAVNMLQETSSTIKKSVELRDRCKELIPEIQAMDPEERTASKGIKWQFGGRRMQGFYDFEEKDSIKIEAAHQAWVEKGKPKKHVERRIDLEIHAGEGKKHKASVDFHLMTQKAMHKGGAVRVVRRFVLPSRAEECCSDYFAEVISLVGDVSGKLEQVNGRKAGMGLTTEEAKELTALEIACVDALRPIVNGFIELAVLCNAGEVLEKLTAVLGPENAGRLGVEASGRRMRLQAVLKVVRAAFEDKTYQRNPSADESAWSRIRPLVFSHLRFYDQSMLELRGRMIKWREDNHGAARRHAFMLAGMLLNEADDEPDFQEQCRKEISDLLREGVRAAMEGGGDLEALRSIFGNAKSMQLQDFRPMVFDWLTARLKSSILSRQPVQWTAELLQKMRELPGIDISRSASPLIAELTQKCCAGIMDGSIPPEQVNTIAIFHGILGSDFDESLFEAVQIDYEAGVNRPLIIEWLVAYCEHTGVEKPSYCMTVDQAEAFDKLKEAVNSRDPGQIKAAVIEAKLVPDLKDNENLCEEFNKALEILKAEARLPPGWDLEDLLGTEKMFKKEQITDAAALKLFQDLMDSTHQKRWTRDRATRGDGEKIADRFEVKHVTEIQNQASWENYDKRRQEIIRSCCPPGRLEHFAPISEAQWKAWSGVVLTRELGDQIAKACELSPLEPQCNEFLFFHGAKPHVADLIAENHFDISFASKDGMFGAGLYFAEASSKSDEYCVPNDNDEYPLILVRVTLGKVNYCDKPKPFDDPGRRALERSCTGGAYHSVLGDRIKVSGTYREYVIYDHFQAYPHFILWYQRV